MQKVIERLRRSYKQLPDKKQYIEFFTALLTIPVLLTVIITNVNSLKGAKTEPKDAPEKIVTIPVQMNSGSSKQSNTPTEECKKGIGTVRITSPEEGENTSENPVNVAIEYTKGGFCSVVWSYRVNGGRWSDYGNTSAALFNPPKGTVKFDLRVKSVVSDDEKNLTRNFIYSGGEVIPTPTNSQSVTATPSAN